MLSWPRSALLIEIRQIICLHQVAATECGPTVDQLQDIVNDVLLMRKGEYGRDKQAGGMPDHAVSSPLIVWGKNSVSRL